ncbi:hypothetical protein U1839_19610 [Sphingomonas sp. RT2P30]|uniref:hypothetical protein n=1 Tax=Parasphingomonas halimpatiens TaxID=3096162 RepID=UPI002FC71E9D
MTRLFLLAGATGHDPTVDAWFAASHDAWRRLPPRWFDRMCACGADSAGEPPFDARRLILG